MELGTSKLCVNEAAVKTHMNNIFHKLSLHDRAQLSIWALRVGLIRPDEQLP